MDSKRTSPGYERWLWIELVGFDNARPDFGVEEYLRTLGFTPHAVSFLMFSPDFVHTHDGMDADRMLARDYGSYFARPYGDRRDEQEWWTKFQLRDLISQLHGHGIDVYFAVFDLFQTRHWIDQHSEILYVNRDGTTGSVCPLKRFADGSYYEDFFAAQVVRVAEDYGFDGYHGADGYAHPRVPHYVGDVSDDMVGQFVEAAGGGDGIELRCDGNPEALERRAAWLWRHRRQPWIDFHVDRFHRFWSKVVGGLHAAGKKVMVNSAWTRDPFEAIYRYGIDYRRMVDAGVDGFIVESVAQALEIDGYDIPPSRFVYDFMAALLLIEAYVPAAKLILLNGIKDIREQWDTLRHEPASLEREIHAFGSMFRRDASGQLQRCAAGLTACLADGIRTEEWQSLRQMWRLAFAPAPDRVLGPTVVWSDAALQRQGGEFAATHRWTTHRILHHLLARGAPIQTIARIEDLDAVQGALLVPNPQLFDAAELERVLRYDSGPVVFIGGETAALSTASVHFADGDAMHCYAFGADVVPPPLPPSDTAAEDLTDAPEPASFVHELRFRSVADAFLKNCVDLIVSCSGGVRVLSGAESVRVLASVTGAGCLRLLVVNDAHHYVTPQLDVGRDIAGIEVLTPFPALPVTPNGSTFRIKVPGRGAVAADVHLAATA